MRATTNRSSAGIRAREGKSIAISIAVKYSSSSFRGPDFKAGHRSAYAYVRTTGRRIRWRITNDRLLFSTRVARMNVSPVTVFILSCLAASAFFSLFSLGAMHASVRSSNYSPPTVSRILMPLLSRFRNLLLVGART